MCLLNRILLRLICAVLLLGIGQAQVRVLLIEGASNHGWENRIAVLESILSKEGGFTLEVELAPANASDPDWATWSPNFGVYDVVVSGYRGGVDGVPEWSGPAKAGFEAFVSGGGGFVAFHEATQAFPNWPAYQSMLALGWRTAAVVDTGVGVAVDSSLIFYPTGVGSITGHGARADSLVTRLGNHPIHAGLPASWMAADLEVVRYPRGPATNFSVISYAEDPDPGAGNPALQWPVEWVVNHGTGRVYASTYGHLDDFQAEPEGMRCAAFQETLVRALRWCAGEVVGSEVPPDFPGVSEVVLRQHTEGFTGFGGAIAVGPFADGVLPDSSIVPTGVEFVPAFPNLSWDSPIDLRPWPGGTDELLIAEMDGRVYRVDNDDSTTVRDLVLDIRDRAWYMNWNAGDPATKHGGIMSCAFHPQFGMGVGKDELFIFYLHHPTDDPDEVGYYYQRVERFVWNPVSESFDVAAGNAGILIQQYDTVKGHDGGSLVFGPDGYLYIPFGDEGTAAEDADIHSQTINDRPRSGVWRIDVDQIGGAVSHAIRRQPQKAQPQHDSFTQGYYVPSDNPWVNPDGSVLEEFYAIGLREPHRMSCDPVTGKFWIGDVGANVAEEVDVMDAPGLNFQWNYKEGLGAGFRDTPDPLIGVEKEPVYQYLHDEGNCIIGGFVYRGSLIPDLQGKYLFGDNGNQQVRALEVDGVTGEAIGVQPLGVARAGGIWVGISSFGMDAQGEPFVLQMGGGVAGGGLISRIQPAGTTSPLNWEYPMLLSETGLFSDLSSLTAAPAMIPYEVNTPLWSAGLAKRRWVMIPSDGFPDAPNEVIGYSENQAWTFPVGTVFVKHFEQPVSGTPVETRLLVHGVDGWGGVTYKWRVDGSDADLLEEGAEELLTVESEIFDYQYPSRSQCNLCHLPSAGFVLGYNTRQLNQTVTYPSGVSGHQIESLSAAGFIEQELKEEDLLNVVTSVSLDDPSSDVEFRVRSYVDSNCAHCHHPGGSSRAFFDARLTTPITNQGLVCGPVIESLGLPAPAVIKPGSLENSVLFHRLNTTDDCCAMPPLAKGRIDQAAVVELAEWILGMTPDACTNAQSFYQGGELGGIAEPAGNGVDGWVANLVINEDATFTNASGVECVVELDRFRFSALSVGDPVTPFVVKVNGDNDFTVLAVGQTRTGYSVGTNDFPFAEGVEEIVLAVGETLAVGFLDSNADGSGGSGGEVVSWSTGGAQIWHGGGPLEGDAGAVVAGQAPQAGGNLETGQNRDYDFFISYRVASVGVGAAPSLPGARNVDGAPSNFVINLDETFTNTTPDTLVVSVDRFKFETTRVTDPITPFVVRLDGGDDFTVLAIGSTQDAYQVGQNDRPFGAATTLISIAPGETVAAGFVDSFADGSGGDDVGAMAFVWGGDQPFYRYHDPDHVGAVLVLGQPPLISHIYEAPPEFSNRTYLFSVSLGFGGSADQDEDGLADSWEFVYAPNLELLGTGDTDGDGILDADEKQAGTDPTDASSRFEVLTAFPEAGLGAAIEFRSVPGRAYLVDWSEDLGDWTEAGLVQAADWPASTTRVVMTEEEFGGGVPTSLFIRVRTP